MKMIRVIIQYEKYYGIVVDTEDFDDEIEAIERFCGESISPVIYVESLDQLEKIGIYEYVEMIKVIN